MEGNENRRNKYTPTTEEQSREHQCRRQEKMILKISEETLDEEGEDKEVLVEEEKIQTTKNKKKRKSQRVRY